MSSIPEISQIYRGKLTDHEFLKFNEPSRHSSRFRSVQSMGNCEVCCVGSEWVTIRLLVAKVIESECCKFELQFPFRFQHCSIAVLRLCSIYYIRPSLRENLGLNWFQTISGWTKVNNVLLTRVIHSILEGL